MTYLGLNRITTTVHGFFRHCTSEILFLGLLGKTGISFGSVPSHPPGLDDRAGEGIPHVRCRLLFLVRSFGMISGAP